MLNTYLDKWSLLPDGNPTVARGTCLLPVRQHGVPAMLRVSTEREERVAGPLMEWWDGDGAARVLARDGGALLLERPENTVSLAETVYSGCDDEACRVLCAVAARLHARREKPLPELTPLSHHFRELEPAANVYGGILRRCAGTARLLMAAPVDVCVLHGDLHHGNVLNFGARGWLAIDPKGLVGERGFDFANIFTNPDLANPSRPVATEPKRFARRLEVVARAAKLERTRLLRWILAWCGLSAAWFLDEGKPLALIDLKVAELAAAELDR